MAFSLNFGIWGELFAVPAAIVDKHIQLCGAPSLKVLLVLLRHHGAALELSDIAAIVGLPEADTRDALNYWFAANLLVQSEQDGGTVIEPVRPLASPALAQPQPAPLADSPAAANENGSEQKVVRLSSRIKLSNEEIAALSKKDSQISALVQEAQNVLGAPLSPSATEMLVSLYSYGGLPVEMILMVMQYCVSIDKKSMRYIETTAYDWIDRGIDTFERAEQHIKEVTCAGENEKAVRKAFDITSRGLTAKEKEYAKKWLEEYGFSIPMISLARERALDAGASRPFAYCDSILSDWAKKGIKTPRQAMDEKAPDSPAPRRAYQKDSHPRGSWNDKSAPPSPERERYDRAHAELQQRRASARAAGQKRKDEVYQKLPRVKAIDSLLAKTGFEVSKAVLNGGNAAGLMQTLKEKNLTLQAEKAKLLRSSGFAEDYLDAPYTCKLCEDKGYTPGGEACSCLLELVKQ